MDTGEQHSSPPWSPCPLSMSYLPLLYIGCEPRLECHYMIIPGWNSVKIQLISELDINRMLIVYVRSSLLIIIKNFFWMNIGKLEQSKGGKRVQASAFITLNFNKIWRNQLNFELCCQSGMEKGIYHIVTAWLCCTPVSLTSSYNSSSSSDCYNPWGICNYDVLCTASESWLSDDVSNTERVIPGYDTLDMILIDMGVGYLFL